MINFTSQESLLFRSCLLSSIWKNVSKDVPKEEIQIATRAVRILTEGGIPERAALVMGESGLMVSIWDEAVDLFFFVLSKRLLSTKWESLGEIRARTGLRGEIVIEQVLAEHRAGRAEWRMAYGFGIKYVEWRKSDPSMGAGGQGLVGKTGDSVGL